MTEHLAVGERRETRAAREHGHLGRSAGHLRRRGGRGGGNGGGVLCRAPVDELRLGRDNGTELRAPLVLGRVEAFDSGAQLVLKARQTREYSKHVNTRESDRLEAVAHIEKRYLGRMHLLQMLRAINLHAHKRRTQRVHLALQILTP